MASPVEIQAVGIKELRRGLKTLGDGAKPAGKELRAAYKGASELVANTGRSKASGMGAGHVAAGSIKARATQTSATVIAGAGVPWFAGWNFGSFRYKQFPPKTKPDYFLYSTVQDKGHEIVEQFSDAIDRLIQSAGFR